MAWTIRFDEYALKQLARLDKPIARSIVRYLQEVIESGDPRSRGKALTDTLVGMWRYRVGDWRVICEIVDDELVVYVLEASHRSSAYQ